VVVAAAVALVAGGSLALARLGHAPSRAPVISRASAMRNQAAAWVAQQVTPSAIISCDPAMCLALKAHGVPTFDLLTMEPNTASPLGSQVVVATAAIRSLFGSRLAAVYAPGVIASFGSGNARIDVRVIAPQGAARYLTQLRTDQQARKTNGVALLTSGRVATSAAARQQLASGEVDSRLMVVLSFLTTSPIRLHVVSFGDSGPGATAGMPLRSATLVGSAASLRSIVASLNTPQAPFRPSRTEMTQDDGQPALVIEFAAPTPLQVFGSPTS
jgi:hypothetical protein